MSVADLNALWEIISVGAGDELNLTSNGLAAEITDQQFLRASEPHLDVVVAREVGEAVVRVLEEAPERINKNRMPLETAPQPLGGDLMCDLAWKRAVDPNLEEVEDIAVEDQLGPTDLLTTLIEVLDELREVLILKKILVRIRTPGLDSLGEVQIADDDSDEAHR